MAAFAAWVSDKSWIWGRILLEPQARSTPRPTPWSRPWPASTSRCTAAILKGAWLRSARSARSARIWKGSPTPSYKPVSPASRRPSSGRARTPRHRGSTRRHRGYAVPASCELHRTGGLGARSTSPATRELHLLKWPSRRSATSMPTAPGQPVPVRAGGRDAPGRLEQSGIIPVYGLGTYADGRPFYAMRFIKGDNLKDAIARLPRRRNVPGAATRVSGPSRRCASCSRRFVERLQRGGVRTQPGRPSPRPEAGQHHAGPLRRDPGGRLGAGQAGWSAQGRAAHGGRNAAARFGRFEHDDPSGRYAGHPGLHEPGAGGRRPRPARSGLRRVQPRGDALLPPRPAGPPFDDRDVDVVLGKVRRGEFPPPRAVNQAIDPAMEAICLKAMALIPEGPLYLPRSPWPTTSSIGWPASRYRPTPRIGPSE